MASQSRSVQTPESGAKSRSKKGPSSPKEDAAPGFVGNYLDDKEKDAPAPGFVGNYLAPEDVPVLEVKDDDGTLRKRLASFGREEPKTTESESDKSAS